MERLCNRLTERGYQIVTRWAPEEARRLRHDHTGPEHLLLGLFREDKSVAAQVLTLFNVTLDKVRDQVEAIIGYGEEQTYEVPITSLPERLLELALRESLRLGHGYIGAEHLLLGLLREPESVATQVLSTLGLERDHIRQEVARMLGYDPEENLEYLLFRGRIEKLQVRVCVKDDAGQDPSQDLNLLVDLDYTYYAAPGIDEMSAEDHEKFLEEAATAIEEKELRSLEAVVQNAGNHILNRFPDIEQVTVSVYGAQVEVERPFSKLSISSSFSRLP